MMRSLFRLSGGLALAAGLAGCAAPRWQITESRYTYSGGEEDSIRYDSTMTLLVDTRTGRTWMLYPMTADSTRLEDEDDHGYSWVPIPVADTPAFERK